MVIAEKSVKLLSFKGCCDVLVALKDTLLLSFTSKQRLVLTLAECAFAV